jgi:flagellar basal body-associated protein FliL
MATPQEATETTPAQETPRKKGGIVLWLLVGVVAVSAGVAVPAVLLKQKEEPQAANAPTPYEMLPPERAMFLPFGEVTVNLNEGRMNRYLRLKISVQIDKQQEKLVQEAISKQGLILRNWLLSHLSDKELDEIRGAAGQNMLRREIRDQFNTVLFADGFDRVYDVLFEEFNVQ